MVRLAMLMLQVIAAAAVVAVVLTLLLLLRAALAAQAQQTKVLVVDLGQLAALQLAAVAERAFLALMVLEV